ncbi:MAG: hypothetical protein V3V49_03460 [Candidatus Krumholzibacteria bacterium]
MERHVASAGRNLIPRKKLRVAFCGLRCLRKGLLAVLGCTLVATTATGQINGTVSLYSESLFTTSEAADTAPGILTVYVVHDNALQPNHTSVMFMVNGGGGFTGTWLDETSQHPVVVGSSPSGITIAYGTCLTAPHHVLTTRYVLFGTSATNSYLQVLGHPDVPGHQILVSLCVGMTATVAGGTLTVNRSVVPTEATTWGRIKALYR